MSAELTNEEIEQKYYARYAAAWVNYFYNMSNIIDDAELIRAGLRSGLDLHMFKRLAPLPRIAVVIGFLRSIYPATLLDIGFGKGAFLWPVAELFPATEIDAIDMRVNCVNRAKTIAEQCRLNLKVHEMDATSLSFEDDAFDCVTALEVLEHIPDWKDALSEVIRVSKRHIVVSFPSKEDDNEEHIHLLCKQDISLNFSDSIKSIKSMSVLNHSVFVLTKG